MNQYELAILRILLKSSAPLSKSKVINGFPDDSSDFVLSAISDLKQENFIVANYEGSSNETLELAKERKKDVLALIRSEPENTNNNSRNNRKPDGKSKGIKWMTATLVIVGGFVSLYIAYAIGVNNRIANYQPAEYLSHDMTFKVVQLSEGKVGIVGDPVFVKHLLEDGQTVSGIPLNGAIVKYYGKPEVAPFTLDIVKNQK
jgi:hypothetical protein